MSNGATTYRLSDVIVTLKADNGDVVLSDVSDHEGATFFSFDGASQYDVIIDQKGFDRVSSISNNNLRLINPMWICHIQLQWKATLWKIEKILWNICRSCMHKMEVVLMNL